MTGKYAVRAACWLVCLAIAAPLTSGCVTIAEFRKLERRVHDLSPGGDPAASAASRERLAALASQLDGLETHIRELEGRIEVAEHDASTALDEARAARSDAASVSHNAAAAPQNAVASNEAGTPGAPTPGARAALDGDVTAGAPPSLEVEAYRAAYAAWRSGDAAGCVDRFRKFLQTYPDSPYADDSAYWLADCYFKQGDYKTAVLRFDDVVSRYPTGNKAADALYRQGEALLRLGPAFGKAAGKAFERVIQEYPDSGRAQEAKRQLALLGSG